MSDFITVQDAARRSHLSEETIRDLCRRNVLKFSRPHDRGQYLIDLESFNAYLQRLDGTSSKPTFWPLLYNQGCLIISGIAAIIAIYTFFSGISYVCDAVSLPYLCDDKSFVGYDFESGRQGWDTSEGSFKLARIESSAGRSYSGQHSLLVTTELYGGATEEFTSKGKEKVFLSTEAKVYFNRFPPQGVEHPGPYDLTEQSVSCYVYFPTGLAFATNPESYVRLFVKDSSESNQYGSPVNISASNVEQWLLLSLTVGAGESMDPDFDPTKTNALGVRVELPEDSALSYVGPFYIDQCIVEPP